MKKREPPYIPNRPLSYGMDLDKQKEKSEAQIQGEIVNWYWNESGLERGLLFSVHNNAVDEVKGGIAKSLGRVSGVSDLIWLSAYGPLLIELKDHRGTQKQDQKEFEKLVTKYDYPYVICRSLEQFKWIVSIWNSQSGRMYAFELTRRWETHCIINGIDKLTGEKKIS